MSDTPAGDERVEAAAKAIHKLGFGDNNANWPWGDGCSACIERAEAALVAADRVVPFPPERLMLAAIQKALNEEAALHDPPEAMYQPSPGQLLDHVHHRIATIAARALPVDTPAAKLAEALRGLVELIDFHRIHTEWTVLKAARAALREYDAVSEARDGDA